MGIKGRPAAGGPPLLSSVLTSISSLLRSSAHKQKHTLILPVLLAESEASDLFKSWGWVMRNETEPFSFVLDIFIYNSRMSSESHAKSASLPLPYKVFLFQSFKYQ